jgi:hypothetical protein
MFAFQSKQGGFPMINVKTFTTEMKIFHSVREMKDLDDQVNKFIEENDVKAVVSVSDTCTTDQSGSTIGLIRVVAYET